MKIQVYIFKIILLIWFFIIFLPMITLAQLISIKTVPIATGNQFLVFPSQNLGMGDVSIAVEDPLLDPFINPAKGARIKGTVMFSSPVYYSISNNIMSARTLPIGALLSSDDLFGGFSLAIQQLGAANANNFQLLSEKYSNNMYASGMIGKRLPGSNISIAGGVFWAGLDAVDGVDLLYDRSQKIEQFGQMVDCRIGFLGELGREHFYEGLLLLNRFNMEHDVTYVNQIWDDWDKQTRVERNLDHSNTVGLHFGYVMPLADNGWLLGGILTGNWKSHPKIPNYELMNIPRDPGNSSAYNLGLGLSKTKEQVTLGIDLIYEPIWSNTWADAAEPVTTSSGRVIPIGGKTVENDFRFSNKLLRIGIHRDEKLFGFQLGLQVRAIMYWLDQYNNVEGFRRKQKEHWSEWTPSWSLNLNFKEFQIRYTGRATMGTGRPGVSWSGFRRDLFFASSADFIIAPSGPLTLQDARVMTHQISVVVPIRN